MDSRGLTRVWNTVKYFGGVRKYLVQLLRVDDARMGTLKGIDKFGNKYYENDFYFFGRNRWVIFSDKYGYDYDGSHIPPEWHGWMHYKTDYLPHEDPARPKYKWMVDNSENLTGTKHAYVPYSTVRPKVEPWVPKKKLQAPAKKAKK